MKNEKFTQIGGLRVGLTAFRSFNATWPFAALTVNRSELGLTCLGKRWSFPRESIRKLSKVNGWLSKGIRIEHRVENYSDYIVFWTFSFDQIKVELEQRGYSFR